MSLFLFPTRVRWSNADGTLTPEAYRALSILVQRVGGILGDQGVDAFADPKADLSSLQVASTDVVAPVAIDSAAEMLQQLCAPDNVVEMLLQPQPDRSMSAADAVSISASPYTFTAARDGNLIVRAGTVSQIEYLRGGSATVIGVTAGLFPLLLGDSIRITYTVAPTVTFIPR